MEAQHNFQPVNFSSSAIVSNSALAQNDGNNMDSLKMSGGGDDSTEEPNEGDELPNGEVLHCSFPGCMKEFTSRWSLTRHTRTHTGERPFKCNLCGKEFVQKCSLKRHEQTHSQEKQWICDFPGCGKRFKLKEYLDVHKRTHNKTEAESQPVEEEDQVIQDAADAAGALIDQLRQRLVRMSVRHHEQLFSYQQREYQLTQSLRECAQALEEAVSLLKPPQNSTDTLQKTNPQITQISQLGHLTQVGQQTGQIGTLPRVPQHLIEASIKFSIMTTTMPQDSVIPGMAPGLDVHGISPASHPVHTNGPQHHTAELNTSRSQHRL